MTRFTRRSVLAASGAGSAALALAACGAGGSATEGPKEEGGVTAITVGASPAPHAEILKFVSDNLAEAAKLKLTITEYTDYIIPNQVLESGEIDANYFQNVPYLETQVEENGYEFHGYAGIHIEPLGLYSATLKSIDELPEGGEIAIANDPTNRGRGLGLLASYDIITLKDGVKVTAATPADVAENPKNLTFTEIEAAQIPRALGDFAAGVVNGNYALEAGIKPSEEALILEKNEDSPYANMLVVREADKDNAALVKLDELLHSADVKKFIEDTYTDGSVIPAF